MLLKIGQRYIETTLIVQWKVGASESGKRELHGYSSEGRSVTITERAEIDALLRWLDAQAMDIMATPQPTAELPLPIGTLITITNSTEGNNDKQAVILGYDDGDFDYPYFVIVTQMGYTDGEWLSRRDFTVNKQTTDPQPAPAETPRTVERRFLVDDRVRVKSGKFAGECGSVHDTNLIGTRFTVYLDSDDIHVFSADALELEPNAVDYEEQPIHRND